MGNTIFRVLATAIFLLFLIQMAGTLVESIYILDLLNTAMDEKALGLLFFFTPLLLITVRKPPPGWLAALLIVILVITRGLTPHLSTGNRLITAGIATGAALLLMPVIFTVKFKSELRSHVGSNLTAGIAFAVGLSVMLRTIHYGLDYSLTPGGGWLGWIFAAILGLLCLQIDWQGTSTGTVTTSPPTLPILGIFLVLTLVYFAFSAPAVIARWTGGDYTGIILATSLLSLGWAGIALYRPSFLENISPRLLVTWNLLFTFALTATLLAHRVPFPPSPESPPVVVGLPTLWQQVPLFLMLLLFPVIFLDMGIFARSIQDAGINPRAWVPGMLLGSLALVLSTFMSIFTNIWGYVEPVSPWFRNKFWLPFALLGLGLALLSLRRNQCEETTPMTSGTAPSSIWFGILGGAFILTAYGALRALPPAPSSAQPNSLVVMTYNIQQANNVNGEKSYAHQLALIQEVNPDILALQENDSTRIGLNNNDYVRYFASRLGYYSYYGPSTTAGTYGTALLARYPLQNPRTVFTFSDKDEIATTEAEIVVAGDVFTIYNVHPAGSEAAKLAFAQALLARSKSQANVIALGDYNLRESEPAYQMLAGEYTNAWMSFYPSGVDSHGLDMSGDRRIDHIFISPHLSARNPMYRLSPESWTDHPAHWAEIFWGE